MEKSDQVKEFLKSKGISSNSVEHLSKFGLSFNPFPRSGISDLNISDKVLGDLALVDENIEKELLQFIVDSLFSNNPESSDKYISALLRGDYGYGKTQTLLYAKYFIESFASAKDELYKKVYVVYIDNPGARLSELIGSIVDQIGEENFRRYLWNVVIKKIESSENIKSRLVSFLPHNRGLFKDDKYDPFSEENTVNYKSFLDTFYKFFPNSKQKNQFLEELKTHTISALNHEFENPIIATYFYNFLSENIGVNKTWDLLTSGGIKNLEKKEVYIIRTIVKLLKSEGYTDFFILVDEFEAVTAGRLSNKEVEQYITNLRTLIDKERNWCSIFAMTGLAYSKLKSLSPPLAERISSRVLDLKPLNLLRAEKLVLNYLNLAREDSQDLYPFDQSGIDDIRIRSKGVLRIFLRSCFQLLQRASEVNNNDQKIDQVFVEKNYKYED